MRRAAEREHVDEHAFVVAAPVVDLELQLGAPGHADVGHVLDRPWPVHPAIQVVRDLSHLLLLRVVTVEISLHEQHAGHEQRGVDGRQLGIAVAHADAEIQEVIEKSLVAAGARRLGTLRQVVQEFERRQHARARLRARDPAAFRADRVGVQREADGRDARERRLRPAIGHESRVGLGRVPEKIEGALFDVLEQRIELVDLHRRREPHDDRFERVRGRRLARGERERRATRRSSSGTRACRHAATGALQYRSMNASCAGIAATQLAITPRTLSPRLHELAVRSRRRPAGDKRRARCAGRSSPAPSSSARTSPRRRG